MAAQAITSGGTSTNVPPNSFLPESVLPGSAPPGTASADEGWQKSARDTLLNMNTTDADVLKFISAELDGGNVSVARQQAITYLIGMRTQLAAMISNVVRTLIDGGNQIIRNIRS